MCFSASASLIAGTTLTVIGKETLKKPKVKTDIPFASIPLIFGIQQFVEGAIWLSFGMPVINQVLAFVYLVFAYVLWPVFVPIAILLMETDPLRQKIIKAFAVCGMIAGMTMLYSILTGPVEAQVIQQSISYSSVGNFPEAIFWLYLAATCFSCIVSSHRMVTLFGITILVSCFTAYQCYASSFFSVWCFFAALLSFMVYLHFHPADELMRQIKERFKIA
jgi:hypothetical protein